MDATIMEFVKIVLSVAGTGIATFLITRYECKKDMPLDKLEITYNRVYFPIYCLIQDEIFAKKLLDWKKTNEVKLVNFSIDKIKAIADKCSDTVSKPSNTGFTEFALNRIDLFEKAVCLEQVFKTPQIQEKEYLGEIEGKGDIYIEKRYRLLCGESRKEEFSKGIHGTKQQ